MAKTIQKKVAGKKAAAKKAAANHAKSRKVTHTKASIRRDKVAKGVIAGKTEKQIAEELNMTRDGVCDIKSHPDFQDRINAALEAEESLSNEEIVGVLAQQMRGSVVDVLPDDGGFITQLKANKLGHLVRKIKLRREIEPGTLKSFEVVEVEVYGSQTAAIHLSKLKGLEQNPRENQIDFEAVKQGYERQISYLIANSKDATTRQQAIAKIAEHEKVSGGEVKILKYVKE